MSSIPASSEPDKSESLLSGFEAIRVRVPDLHNIIACCKESQPSDDVKVDLLFVRFQEDRPKENELAELLFQELINYCIPKRKLAEELERARRNGRSEASVYTRMLVAARNAFIKYKKDNSDDSEGDIEDKKNTNIRFSELGELLAYCIAIEHLSAGQVAAKMALKTNSEMPVFGLDGIHANVDEEGVLNVYYLESKMTKDAKSGGTQYAASAGKFEKDRAHKLNEYRIARDLSNLDAIEGDAREAALEYFNPYSSNASNVRERFVGIIMHTEPLYDEKLPIDDRAPPTIHETTFARKYEALHTVRTAALKAALTKAKATPGKSRAFFIALPNVNVLKELFAREMSGE